MCEMCDELAQKTKLDPVFLHEMMIEKADDDPLERIGLLRWEVRIERMVTAAVQSVIPAAFKNVIDAIMGRADEAGMTASKLGAIAGKALKGLGSDVVAAVEASPVPKAREKLAKRTRETIAREYGLETIFPKEDKAAQKVLKDFNHWWLREHFDNEVVERAKAIVGRQFETGVPPKVLAKVLAEEFADLGESKAYWTTVASAWSVQTRTLQSLRTYAEVGIDEFEFYNINDKRTSEVCKKLIGKRWKVKRAIEQFETLMASRSREDAQDMSPWLSVDGEGETYFKQGGEKRYLKDLTDEELGEAGILWPPRHGRCRSTIIAVSK